MSEQYTDFVVDDTKYITKINKKFASRKNFTGFHKNVVTAFIPGLIREILVKPGQRVVTGEKLLVLEAMKMKNLVTAPMDGVIKSVNVLQDTTVSKNQLLIEINPD